MTAPISPATSPLPAPLVRPTASPGAAQRFFRHPLAWLGLALLGTLVFLALFAPFLAKGEPLQIFPKGLDAVGVPDAPSGEFPLGADTLGRDVWTRVLYGARLSLVIALCAMLTSTLIGTTIGLLAGFYGGWVDRWLTRLTEIVSSLPTILLAITLTLVLPKIAITLGSFAWPLNSFAPTSAFWLAKLPAGWRTFDFFASISLDPRLVLAIGLVTWTNISRAVRGQVLTLKEREFVEAARALGMPNATILTRHILPNVLPTVITLATLATASNTLLEASLSYLGLGTTAAPSWGAMIAEGQPYFSSAPWITLAPGVAIVMAVVAFNLLGNALTEALETRR